MNDEGVLVNDLPFLKNVPAGVMRLHPYEPGMPIEELQRLMYVARVKAVGERSDDYNYTYDLFVRRYPETVKAAEKRSSLEANATVLRRLLDLAGGVTPKQIGRLFDWDDERVARTIDAVEAKRGLVRADGLVLLPELAR